MKSDQYIVTWDAYVKTSVVLTLIITLLLGFSLGIIVHGLIIIRTDSPEVTLPVIDEIDTSSVCETEEITEETSQETEETSQITEEITEIFELVEPPT